MQEIIKYKQRVQIQLRELFQKIYSKVLLHKL